MKKILFFFILLLFLLNNSFAQIVIEWQKTFGGTGNDNAKSVQQTADGGFVVAGYSASNNGDVTGNHGNQDYWVAKMDSSGNLQWQKSLGGTFDDNANAVLQTSDGGYVVAGESASFNGDVTGNIGNWDYWVVKLDGSGNMQWQKSLGGTGTDKATAIDQTSDGGFVVTGLSNSNDVDVTGNNGLGDMWVVKLDATGNIQWQKSLGGTLTDYAQTVQQTVDGGYVVAGYTESDNGDVTGNHGDADYWVVKLDVSGNIQWQKCLGGSSNDIAYSVLQTADGHYVVAGTLGSYLSCTNANDQYWLVKLDGGNGNIIWQRCLGGTWDDGAHAFQQTNDGGFVVAGKSNSNNGDVTGNHGSDDYWVVKLDGSGYLQWQKSLGGTNQDQAYALKQTADGSYVVAGFTSSNDGDVTGHHGLRDFWVVKLTEIYNRITGKLYADLNSNNAQDGSEPILANRMVFEQNTNRFGFSNSNGNFEVYILDSGNYTVSPVTLSNFISSPLTHDAYFSSILQTDSLNNFAFQPAGIINDLCITITPATAFRSGMNATYVINYENTGTTTINNCSVIFFAHSLVSYVSSSVTPFSVMPDSVVWNIGTITPFQSGTIVVTVQVQIGTPIGTLINSGVRIEPVAGDANPGCNTCYWEVLTTGAFDPNDILVSRATLFTDEFPNPPFLEYLIRFQNVGNDTAFNVIVFNPIDTNKLEINSLEFVSSSNTVDMRYLFHEKQMKFMFNNILLPDSNVNEPMSHGFIRYKIKPKSTLVVNDSIRNDAVINFDFEAPVFTNTALTTIVLPTSINTDPSPHENLTVWIWPNPVKEKLNVGIKSNIREEITIEILNIFGQTVSSKNITIERGENKFEMPIEELSGGIYLIKTNVEGNLSQSKFIKL